MRSFISALIPILVIAPSLLAQTIPFQLEVMTHMNTANELLVANDRIYAATEGGLIDIDRESADFSTLTALDGMFDHNLTAVEWSDKGQLILGSVRGNVAFYDPASGQIENNENLKGNLITDIVAVADTLWVLTPDFVSVFLYDESRAAFQFRETYQEFGRTVGGFQRLALAYGRIWLAGSSGLVSAPSNFLRFNLYAGSNWQILDAENGLPASNLSDIAWDSAGNQLLLATTAGLVAFDQVRSSVIVSTVFQNLAVSNEGTFAATDHDIYRINGSVAELLHSIPQADILDVVVDDGVFWTATLKQGIQNLTDGQQVLVDGPLANYIGEVLVDSRGRLWATCGLQRDELRQGIFVRENDEWRNYLFSAQGAGSAYRFMNSSLALHEDQEGNIWVGAWGGGVIVFDDESNINPINTIEPEGQVTISSVRGAVNVAVQTAPELLNRVTSVSTNQSYSVISDIFYDQQRDAMWLLNFAPQNNRPLLEHRAATFGEVSGTDNGWLAFALPFSVQVIEITQDIFGDLWIGSLDGVIQVRLSEDNLASELYQEADNLKSNLVRAIAADEDGYVWVGTGAGLSAILNGTVFDFRGDYQPIGLQINDIYVDARNNKWFATDKGLSILRGSGSPFEPQSWIHLIPRNSSIEGNRTNLFLQDLPTENFHSVFLDTRTSDAYLGTDAGIVILRSNPFASTLSDFSSLKAGPNPYILGSSGADLFNFHNIVSGSEVKILTVDGQLIRTLDPQNFDEVKGGLAQWDGRNLEGKLVASGVYVYLVSSEDGQQEAGKILVVRR